MTYLMKNNPYGTLNLYDDFDRGLSRIFDDMPEWNTSVPVVDIREDEKGYLLEAELPGLSEKDVEVKVEDNLLSLSSVKKEENEEKRDNFIMKERRERSFARSFVLPKDADKEKIEAHFSNGVLSLSIPRVPKEEPKTIKINKK